MFSALRLLCGMSIFVLVATVYGCASSRGTNFLNEDLDSESYESHVSAPAQTVSV